jgi:hypothetical protein
MVIQRRFARKDNEKCSPQFGCIEKFNISLYQGWDGVQYVTLWETSNQNARRAWVTGDRT